MNDNQLSTMVRESVADVRSSTPVDQIISRGRAVRARRRRVPAVAGALVVAGGAALGVTTLALSGHPAPTGAGKAGSHPAAARLAAWTVTKQPNGDIDITIRQLQNPAQLQATLRADGLPAHVNFTGQPDNAVCQPYDGLSLRNQFFTYSRTLTDKMTRNGSDFAAIHPSGLPSGVGLNITVGNPKKGLPAGTVGNPKKTIDAEFAGFKGQGLPPVVFALVHASQQCTG